MKQESLFNIYVCQNSIKDLNSIISNIECPKGSFINTLVLNSKYDLLEILPNLSSDRFLIQNSEKNKLMSVYSIKHTWGRERKSIISGQFVLIKSPEQYVYIVISLCRMEQWRNCIVKYFDSIYPKANRVFLTQKELYLLMEGFKSSLKDIELRLNKIVSRGKIFSKSAKKRYESDVRWTDLSLEEAFHEAKEKNEWFKAISFNLIRHNISSEVYGRITKYGAISTNGFYEHFYEKLVTGISKYASLKFIFYMNRSRKEITDYKPKPIEIEYDYDIFEEKSQRLKFINTMSKIQGISCSVIHNNPYIQLSLADYSDGSSCDIYVLKTNRVLIIPQVKASEAALKKISNHIF